MYLTAGADMVAYSGGKCLRGPQCAGLLLGRKDLLQAASINSAPHHAFGRALKVAKEEIMGLVAAVEAWTRRDHAAEWKQWEGWLATIRESVSAIPTVRTEVLQPSGPSNYAPQLRVSWDTKKLGITGMELADLLLSGDPRIVMPAGQSSVTIMPYMMMPGDDKLVAPRLHELLSKPLAKQRPAAAGSTRQVGGQWVKSAPARGDPYLENSDRLPNRFVRQSGQWTDNCCRARADRLRSRTISARRSGHVTLPPQQHASDSVVRTYPHAPGTDRRHVWSHARIAVSGVVRPSLRHRRLRHVPP